LSGDEFEVFCYLLLLREHARDGVKVVYYGKTGDGGRDIVRTATDGTVELIQCKRYGNRVGLPDVRAELAKLCANVFSNRIPVAPARVVFYVVPDLTSDAIDLLSDQSEWIGTCEKALEQHLKELPTKELVEFAKSWWPAFAHEDEHKLTLRAKSHAPLIDEFFSLQPVITGSAAETRFSAAHRRGRIEAIVRIRETPGGRGFPRLPATRRPRSRPRPRRRAGPRARR
jgi:hypothetical protein